MFVELKKIELMSVVSGNLSGLVGKTLLTNCKGRGFESHPSNMPVGCFFAELGKVPSTHWCIIVVSDMGMANNFCIVFFSKDIKRKQFRLMAEFL